MSYPVPISERVLNSMRAIVDYDWQTEATDFERVKEEDEETEGHIFEHLQVVDEFLQGEGK